MNETQKFGEHELLLLYHPFTTETLRKHLDHLRYNDGDFKHVLRDERIYTTLQAVVAYDDDGFPRGWSGIYRRPEDEIWHYENQEPPFGQFTTISLPTPIIGVYVQEEFRHIGLGGTLKSRAQQICKMRGLKHTWQDHKTRGWIEVDIDGSERRWW
jgi:GNAT superfamily N-acetyltransferase